VVEEAKATRPVHISPWLFCNKYGHGYMDEETGIAEGWSSMWHRFMLRVLKETALKESFTEHDLRAKAGSDAGSSERARSLLTHSDIKTTERIYRRKAEIIKPLR
jgi:integrase